VSHSSAHPLLCVLTFRSGRHYVVQTVSVYDGLIWRQDPFSHGGLFRVRVSSPARTGQDPVARAGTRRAKASV